MDAIPLFRILSYFMIFTTIPSLSANPCTPDSCHQSVLGPQVRFPFRLSNRQLARCGYPGFDLYCNSLNQTILSLPESGEFVVDHIDYTAQALYINDPGACLPGRILNFSLSGSPFRGPNNRNFTFLNCSSDSMDYSSTHYMPLYCLSRGRNYTILAVSSAAAAAEIPAGCRRVGRVMVPLQWTPSEFVWSPMDLMEDLELVWSEPSCWECENDGGVCGYKGDSTSQIACFMPSKEGLRRSARYGIIIGVGVPGLVCIIGLACYGCGMVGALNIRQLNSNHLPRTVLEQGPTVRSSNGLDRPTIESYPTRVLGESCRLPVPEPSDGTCPICLSNYKPKETLRSIPECNHFFHAHCIDEWLKLNATCPLCRNSPDTSMSTPCFSISTSSSTSTPSTRH